MQILPRLIRKSDAPAYLDMNKNKFTKTAAITTNEKELTMSDSIDRVCELANDGAPQ